MDWIKKMGNSKRFCSLLILWAMTAVSCLVIFFPFLFGDKLAVFQDAGSDTRQQYLMQYATIVNHIKDGNFSFWDFNNGFGTSMLALNLFNPFLMLVYLAGVILGVGHIPGVLVFVILLEIFLAQLFCYLFLDCFSFSEGSKIIASYIYGLSGYLLVWGQHYQFGAFVVFLPLLLFLLERAIRRGKFSLTLPLLVAVMVCSSVYMSYMSLMIGGCYLLYRMVVSDQARGVRVRKFFLHCASILLGIGIGMVIFLPTAYYLFTISSRLDSDASFLTRIGEYLTPYSLEFYKTAFLRLFSTTFQGIQDYNGYSNFYEAPVLFFSALFVLLGFQYLFTVHRQETSRKAKVMQYLAVLFFAVCMFTRIGASAFNAFAYPFSRHSFVFLPFFALMTAFTLDQLWLRRKISKTGFVLSCLCTAAAHYLALGEVTEALLHRNVILMCILAFVMAAALLLGFLKKGAKWRRAGISLLISALGISLCLEGWTCFNDRDTLTTTDASYWGGLYDPNVAKALDYLKSTDPSFYRVEKDYYSGSYCMDGLAQNYRGISTYNSTPNRFIQEFIDLVTPNLPIMAEHEYTWRQIGYYSGHSTLFGIKYVLSKNPDLQLDGFSLLEQFGDIYIYQNSAVESAARFYVSAGDDRVLSDAYGSLELERLLLENVLLDKENDALTEEMTGEEMKSQETLRSDYALEQIPCTIEDIRADGGDSVTISLDRDLLDKYRRVYLEFDIRTPTVSDITVNQDEPLEYHFRVSARKKKHVQVVVPSSCESITLTRYGGRFEGTIKNIRLLGSKTTVSSYEGADIRLEVTSDSCVAGTLNAENSGYLFLPIPYEKGWTAQVDGIETEILQTDVGFVSIPVGAGEHSFTFTYQVPYMQEGAFVSILSLLLWAGILGLRVVRFKNRT
ncbi:MAG: YfhO family protein [Lachnospiraceae bacterium]|nr:YfhO family protein [Lachnospiraceae bacterium]